MRGGLAKPPKDVNKLNAWQKWRMCGRKKSYPTLSKANKAAAKHNLHVYKCLICHCWHTTKMEQS